RPPPASAKDYRYYLADLQYIRTSILSATGRPREAEAAVTAALRTYEALARREPYHFAYRVQMEPSYALLGAVKWALGKDAEAADAWAKAEAAGQALHRDFPSFLRPNLSAVRHQINALIEWLRRKQPAGRAVAAADRLAALDTLNAEETYDL